MTGKARPRNGGFTLVEILIVVVVMGLLASIAIPNFQSAIWKARASEVVADVHTITLAYHEYLADGGGRLNSARWGTVPAALRPYLPDGFSFSTEIVDYRWTRVRPAQSPWDLEMGMIRVRPQAQFRNLMIPKLDLVAPSATSVVTRNQVRFYITP